MYAELFLCDYIEKKITNPVVCFFKVIGRLSLCLTIKIHRSIFINKWVTLQNKTWIFQFFHMCQELDKLQENVAQLSWNLSLPVYLIVWEIPVLIVNIPSEFKNKTKHAFVQNWIMLKTVFILRPAAITLTFNTPKHKICNKKKLL